MRWSFVASLVAAALVAGTSASEAIPARGVSISAAAKSVQLSELAHYKRCACHVVHRPKKVVHKRVAHRKHIVHRERIVYRERVVRPIVVVDEPDIVIHRRFVHRPFFAHHVHFGHRRFFHHAFWAPAALRASLALCRTRPLWTLVDRI